MLHCGHQCAVYNFKYDLCYVDYVSYTTRYLHQCIEEHKVSVIGKHMKEVHGVAFTDLVKMFSIHKKCEENFTTLLKKFYLFVNSQTQYVQKSFI